MTLFYELEDGQHFMTTDKDAKKKGVFRKDRSIKDEHGRQETPPENYAVRLKDGTTWFFGDPVEVKVVRHD